jgi:hypothetical protein
MKKPAAEDKFDARTKNGYMIYRREGMELRGRERSMMTKRMMMLMMMMMTMAPNGHDMMPAPALKPLSKEIQPRTTEEGRWEVITLKDSRNPTILFLPVPCISKSHFS